MNDKTQIMAMLEEEFQCWEQLLSGLSDGQISAPNLPGNWSVKDVIAHLWAWQQRTIARMEAALHDRKPVFPSWPAEFDPEAEGQPDQLNAWLYETYREKPWSRVYGDWTAGFQSLLELGEAIPEKDLLDPERYAWLEGYRLSFILVASYEHHKEHRGWLLAWLHEHWNMESAE